LTECERHLSRSCKMVNRLSRQRNTPRDEPHGLFAGARFVSEAVQPMHFRFVAKPGHLSFGVVPVALLCADNGVRQCHPAARMTAMA
jgi:hypothetical protein